MGTILRQLALVCLCACSEDASSSGGSPCKAFPQAPSPRYELEPFANVAGVTRITSSETRGYGLAGKRVVGLPDGATLLEVDGAIDIAARGSTLWVLKSGLEVVRFTTADGGKTFGAPQSVTSIQGPTTGAIAISEGDVLWVAAGGEVRRIEKAATEVFARGFQEPSAIAVDPDSGDVWVLDRGELHRVVRDRTYGADGGGAAPMLKVAGTSLVVHRGGVAPIAGKPIAGGSDAAVTAIVPFAASGPAAPLALNVGNGVVGRGPGGELLVARADSVHRVRDIAPSALVPRLLSQTGCLDPKAAGAVEYEVASPLWSDGATKSRAVVLPGGAKGRTIDDGDVRLPVGTVAMKTFVQGGKKIETRLLVHHSLETWVGYSYAWNDAGTDAELVIGNRTRSIGDTRWYFPSTADCTACHTPAAGYILGIEAAQVANLDALVQTPIDRTKHPLFESNASSPEAKARQYLHANCSVCHRGGSVTGAAELDLRFSTPLAGTGLCAPPRVTQGRLIVPKDPAQSIVVQRMRALDETRMPKLATRVVDEAGVALISDWIQSLSACP